MFFDYNGFIPFLKAVSGCKMYHEKQFDSAYVIIGMRKTNVRECLWPEIPYWYKRIEDKAIELAPSNLMEKVHITQDRILWMKFRVDISKRVVQSVMQ